MYQHVQGKSSSVVDTGAIDKANVTTEKMERTVGEIFSLSKEASERITTADQEAPLTCIKQLIKEGLIPKESFSKEVMFYLMKTTNDEENQIYMVLRKKGDERLMQNIERYKDANSIFITRKKGGIIHAMLNKLPEYQKYKHFILPLRNEGSKARFYVKTNLGHSILINKKNA